MAHINLFLPDDLAAQARAAGLNVSSLAQEALRSALAAGRVEAWLDNVTAVPSLDISHSAIAQAVADARDDLDDSHG